MSLRDRLVAFIEELDVEMNRDLKDDTSLIKSGMLDSLALFQLAEWIEREVKIPFDLTKFNLTEEWDTVVDILNFINNHRKF